jgi:predicted translin family RNA/ssDNA-binding protein
MNVDRPTPTFEQQEQPVLKKATPPTEPLQAYFSTLAAQNDANNDRRERLIRATREITRNSKKVISLLQRANGTASDAALLKQAHDALVPIRVDLAAVVSEIGSQDVWRHKSSWSGGVQEYIEAVSFLHFVQTGELLSMAQAAREMMPSVESDPFPLHLDDYLAGIADLSGELMRTCVSAAGNNKPAVARQTCAFVRQLHAQFATLAATGGGGRDMGKKCDVMQDSLKKMEQACFQLKLRESEAIPSRQMSFAFDAVNDEQQQVNEND